MVDLTIDSDVKVYACSDMTEFDVKVHFARLVSIVRPSSQSAVFGASPSEDSTIYNYKILLYYNT